jgi:hypothetical protein
MSQSRLELEKRIEDLEVTWNDWHPEYHDVISHVRLLFEYLSTGEFATSIEPWRNLYNDVSIDTVADVNGIEYARAINAQKMAADEILVSQTVTKRRVASILETPA